ncbi:MAG: aminoglycoside phosphotransferase family protein [Pseudomonadota bacterium]
MQLSERCGDLVEELELGRREDIISVEPLTGGVASDIAVVDLGHRKICAKFALPKLKVAADWHVPVHRNAAEYAWLTFAGSLRKESAVGLYGRPEAAHGFAMEYLDGADVYLWKDHLLRGMPNTGEAARVADLLGLVHAASARAGFDSAPFKNRDDFHAIRIEPYLSFTRQAHPALAEFIAPVEAQLYESSEVLVHGDASPKNILFRGRAPIVLDAECATMGDASFDPAFCLNHLVLKAIHLPASRAVLIAELLAFWAAYEAHVDWEERGTLEARVCRLLPMLMLARVDGKSPVEYLSKAARQQVRDIAIPLITSPETSLDGVVRHLSGKLL